MSPTINRIDPYLAGNFLVSIGGAEPIACSEVSGLEMAIDVVEYRTGNMMENTLTKLAGLSRFPNVTLRRGLTQDTCFWSWINSAILGRPMRSTVTIALLDQSDNQVWVWKLNNAWPSKWTGPDLAANTSEVAIEALEIAHEGIELVFPSSNPC